MSSQFTGLLILVVLALYERCIGGLPLRASEKRAIIPPALRGYLWQHEDSGETAAGEG